METTGAPSRWFRPFWRGVLSAHVLNGAAVALGLLLVAASAYVFLGSYAAINCSVGAIIALLSDGIHPRRGKINHLVAGPLVGVPLFLVVQLLRGDPLALGLVLVAGSFVAFLATAWGPRGMPTAAAIMFAMLLAMAPQPAASSSEALLRTLWCAMGAAGYVTYGTMANMLLNGRFRAQLLANLLVDLASLLRVHARRVTPSAGPTVAAAQDPATLEQLLQLQAALADQMQTARNIILERPRTARRQRLAGLLMLALEMRDQLIASELELESGVPEQTRPVLREFAAILHRLAADVDAVADSLLLGRRPPARRSQRGALDRHVSAARAGASAQTDDLELMRHAALVRSMATRLGYLDGTIADLTAVARRERAPDLRTVRAGWRLFVSPSYWSLQPLLRLWHWRQPALRHAVRAALAIGTGYVVARLLPWGSRDYWVLLTIVVVLRGSLAQTLQRRNARVLGTVLGSLMAAVLLAGQLPAALLLLVVVVAQGVAHAFVLRRYVVTAVAGSVLALILADMLYAGGGSPLSAFAERVGDTLLGTGIAWLFSYVLPSWERHAIRPLVHRVCRAMARHAGQSLTLAEQAEITGQPELTWRLARREAYDALSALVQATGRGLAEPRSVRPPLAALEKFQASGYELLGQLSAIQSMLLLRRDKLQLHVVIEPLTRAVDAITAVLDLEQPSSSLPYLRETPPDKDMFRAMPEDLPDLFLQDSTPWLLRRLNLARALALNLRADAERVLHRLPAP
ncbi:MAG: FUSC family membrane protein [Ottowia sp.]|nr:FUSC family protein [Ottowia sp.]